MSIEVPILISIIGLIITIAVTLGNKAATNRKEGERWGRLETTLENLKLDNSTINTNLSNLTNRLDTSYIAMQEKIIKSSEEMRSEIKESVTQVHERLDNHMREEHEMHIPKRR